MEAADATDDKRDLLVVVPVLLLLQLLLLLLLAGEEVEEEEEDDDMVMDEPRENRLRPPLSGFCRKAVAWCAAAARFSRRRSSVLIIGRAMTMTRSTERRI